MLKVWTRECEACGNMGEEMRRNQYEKCDTGSWMWEWPYARQFGKIRPNLTRKLFPVREFSDFTTKSKNFMECKYNFMVYTHWLCPVPGQGRGTTPLCNQVGENHAFKAHLHLRRRTRVSIQIQIPVLYRIRDLSLWKVNMFCTVQCSH